MLKILTAIASFMHIACASSDLDTNLPTGFLKTASIEFNGILQDPDKIVDNDPRAGAHDCEEQLLFLWK